MLITLLNPKAIVFYMAFLPAVCRSGAATSGLLTFGVMAVTIAATDFCSMGWQPPC